MKIGLNVKILAFMLLLLIPLVIIKLINSNYYADVINLKLHGTLITIGLFLLFLLNKNYNLSIFANIVVSSLLIVATLFLFYISIPNYTYLEAKMLIMERLDDSVNIVEKGLKREGMSGRSLFNGTFLIDGFYNFNASNKEAYLFHPNTGAITEIGRQPF